MPSLHRTPAFRATASLLLAATLFVVGFAAAPGSARTKPCRPGHCRTNTVSTTTTAATTTTTTTTSTTTTTTTTTTPRIGTSLPAPLPASTGRAYYVDGAAGSDANAGTAVAPFRTIEHALGVATSPGSIVYVGSGTYGAGATTKFVWAAQGTATAPITLAAYPGQHPVLAKLYQLAGSYLRLTGFKIVRNSYPTDTRFGQSGSNPGGNVGLWLRGCSSCQVDHDEITGQTQTGLFISGSNNVRVLANWIHANGTTHDDHGIYFCSGSGGLLANNLVAHNYDYGIQLYCSSSYPVDPVITDNTVVYNGTAGSGGSGMVLEAQNATVINNVVAYNLEYGIRGWSPGSGTIRSNDLYGNAAGAFYQVGGYTVTSNLLANPLFTNASGGAFSLQLGSPAVDSGDGPYSDPVDLGGVSRPRGNAADLGAYESH